MQSVFNTFYTTYAILCHVVSHTANQAREATPDLSQEKITAMAGQMIIAHQKERTIKPGINRLILKPILRIVFRLFLSVCFRWFVARFFLHIFQVELVLDGSVTSDLIYRTLISLFAVPFLMECLMIEQLIEKLLTQDPAEFIFLWITGETTFFSRKVKKIFVKFAFPTLVIIHLIFRDQLVNMVGTFLINKLADLLYQACFLKAGAVFRKEYAKWTEQPKVKLHTESIKVEDDDYLRSH